tara:strand:+ start:305 stop:931 length:627 start_codon:yes stop_codon:yes gene_type:complete
MAKKLSEKSAAVVDLVAKWRALPQELRQNKSLASLARANGFAPNSYFYDLANGPEVYHQMLIEVAGKAVGKAPEILDVLAEHAQRGHAKSAEIYLNFVRQTITDERLIAQLKPRAQLIETLEDVAKVGETFLALADSLPTPEDAEAFVSSMGNDAVDAEWSEAPRNDKVPSDSVPEVPSLPGVAEAAGGDPPPRGVPDANQDATPHTQ